MKLRLVFVALLSIAGLARGAEPIAKDAAKPRVRIYQLFVRQFSNINQTRKPNGTLVENGVGKFNDINDAALASLQEMGFTHIWLTGVLQQATATDYSSIGQPADDPDLLKGIAGSPYAIKDYFDVCPDYAVEPAKRLEEFKSLLARIHQHHLSVLIDLVPNHVARSYNSDIKPELNFGTKGNGGAGDDVTQFFSPDNNFFYLQPDEKGPPLRLPSFKDGKPISPTCKVDGVKCDGLFEPEREHGKVTGNNKTTWTPDLNDWYETVKLNYGFDFTDRTKSAYPTVEDQGKEIPDTWKKMAAIIDYWQSAGIDGFRCDMSHMVPPEFWKWAIAKARAKNADVIFIGEAYDSDPAKVPRRQASGTSAANVMSDLLDAGFSAVYDDPTYRAIKKIYEGPGWANDIDRAMPVDSIRERSLRYAENHDEVRLASRTQWGGYGKPAGPAISAILWGTSIGPVMLYNGQEVGEPAEGAEGFGGDDSRTSIFDYWSMPQMVKWVGDHRYLTDKLSPDEAALRHQYAVLLELMNEPAFRSGQFIPLNKSNESNPHYGRLNGETASGHWIYSCLRSDATSGQVLLLVANLNPKAGLKDIRITIPAEDLTRLRFTKPANEVPLPDKLWTKGLVATSKQEGILLEELPSMTVACFELRAPAQ